MPVLASRVNRYPFMAWERLKPLIQWKQGQHVFTCGGTGTGKSTVAGEFLPRRKQVVVCVSKGMDEIFDGPYYKDYKTIQTWRPGRETRVLLRPANQKTLRQTRDHKHNVFAEMFDNILLQRGNWCVDVDETHYMSKTLGLRDEITDMLEQGRSAGISMWNNTQRPADIPLSIYVNSSHAFLFQAQEDYDLQRLANLGNRHTNAKEMRANLDALDSFDTHELVYLDRTGRIPPVRTIVKLKGSKDGAAKRNVRR